MQQGDPWFHPFDWCAMGLLAVGCASGILALMLRAPVPVQPPQKPVAAEQTLSPR